MPVNKKQQRSLVVTAQHTGPHTGIPDNNNSSDASSSQATTKTNSKKRPRPTDRSPSPSSDIKTKSPKKSPSSNYLKSPTPSNNSSTIMSTSTQNNSTSCSKFEPNCNISNNEMFNGELDDKPLDGANIGHEYQALIPKNSSKKFHSVEKFDHTYETCLWKPPIHTEAQHKRWLKELDAFLKSYIHPAKKKELNEAQILGILMVNNYDIESAREDMKHYESTLLQGETLSMENSKKLQKSCIKMSKNQKIFKFFYQFFNSFFM